MQHTRIAVGSARWNFSLFLSLKNNEKFRWVNATAMREYEMNPPLVLGVFWT